MDKPNSLLPENPKTILWGNGDENKNSIPEIIWVYWDSVQRSHLVELCLSKIVKILPAFKINVLNDRNLKDFLPDIVQKRNDLPVANYADLIRLELLAKYGGIWMDASILITENLDWIYDIKNKFQTDLIGFYSEDCTNDFQNPILENWFLATPKNNKFIVAWRDVFYKCYTSDKPREYHSDIIENPLFIQNIGDRANYLLPYLSAIKVMRTSSDYRIFMISGEKTAHFYNFGGGFTQQELLHIFLKEKTPSVIPKLIKFEKNRRNLLEQELYFGRYNSDSFLIELAEEDNPAQKKILRKINYAKFIFDNLMNKYLKKNKKELE